MKPDNCYDDARRADAYAKLEFPGTYYLAFRDLPDLIFEQVGGRAALDFGCGAGRSTRFLRQLGFDAIGVDVSAEMVRKALEIGPGGDYRLIDDSGRIPVAEHSCDLVLCAFTFDAISTMEQKVMTLRTLGRTLRAAGRIICLVSTPEIYVHEWASFSTRAFPENRTAQCGDAVRIIITEIDDRRPVKDVIWTDDAYRDAFDRAGLSLVRSHKPLARADEPFSWVNETRIAPWAIYVLELASTQTTPENG